MMNALKMDPHVPKPLGPVAAVPTYDVLVDTAVPSYVVTQIRRGRECFFASGAGELVVGLLDLALRGSSSLDVVHREEMLEEAGLDSGSVGAVAAGKVSVSGEHAAAHFEVLPEVRGPGVHLPAVRTHVEPGLDDRK
ncbi:hypothetical protein KQX54_003840 [Cotesia glomerata]|uniref:Uncharacterized protein n=1 Tax=Cotesia glomerata TaxID=32391 RepID=A0AAV7IJE1_COTGL|nr:hypothetical protein KQX54_003840 [Cotesia glomerata]